ncbi:DeoR/GlpR family DNA-binding transcription regulator [Enterococcus alishanensis]|uniref:DeoR/GlpR family DNA-binding transcription regulator n=1 Tax=Enterococcus alishanensis TaxID=1303817 RepID=A0ABS6TA09_9ENTE|nr:DeoR/GlpR family DNA-binding transcription regulator [Enterococcus alishanensis]
MKNSIATIEQRHKNILNILEQHERMTTQELANSLGVSISTIRRDLNILEEKNDIQRKYGYCIFNYDNQKNFDASGPELIKQSIARIASTYVSDYDTVFINSSSTALNTVNYLKAKHLTIVTNNLKIAHLPHNANYNYILTGGELRFPKEVLVGDIAIDTITSTNADICIIGCSGVDIVNGVTTKILNEAKINELMIKQTVKYKILVADHRKVGLTSKFKIADLSVFDCLITDRYCPPKLITQIEKAGLKVIKVQ